MLRKKWMNENIIKTKEGLLAPVSYITASEKRKKKIFNGCGPEGFLERIIPDNILGTSVSSSCSIHDWMFHYSKTQNDREIADKAFKVNIYIQLNKKSNIFKKLVANIYYFAVRLYSKFKS